jgi:putative hemolysin
MARFWPLRIIARGLIGLTNVIIPGKGLKMGPFVSEEELLALADQAVSADVLDSEERELIEQVIEFGDTICREVMVPRPDMLAVSDGLTVSDVLDLALSDGRSRVPVYGEGIDDITGIAYVKDLVRASRAGRESSAVSRFSRKPFFVPETKHISNLLSEMRLRKAHLAIVIDEYGGTAGLVTMEDLLEELVGEIVDEFDREEPMLERLPGGAIRVQARMAMDEVDELLGVELPEGDWDTIGGLMFHLLGHVPFEGESVRSDGFTFRAEQVKGRRIGMVQIERVAT